MPIRRGISRDATFVGNAGHPGWLRTALACLLVGVVAAGCGASGSSSYSARPGPSSPAIASGTEAPGSAITAIASPPPVSESSSIAETDSPNGVDGLTEIGTIALKGPGESVTSTIAVSQPILPTDPEVPPGACGPSSRPDTIVTILGSITIQYTGNIAGTIDLDPTTSMIESVLVDGGGNEGFVTFQTADGGWACDGSQIMFQMDPGQTTTLQWQAQLPEISNAQPTFTDHQKTGLYVQFHATAIDLGYPDITTTGVGAANCNEDPGPDVLLLYARAPRTYHTRDVYGGEDTTVCRRPQ